MFNVIKGSGEYYSPKQLAQGIAEQGDDDAPIWWGGPPNPARKIKDLLAASEHEVFGSLVVADGNVLLPEPGDSIVIRRLTGEITVIGVPYTKLISQLHEFEDPAAEIERGLALVKEDRCQK